MNTEVVPEAEEIILDGIEIKPVDTQAIQEETVILSLELGKVTNRRIVSSETENIDTEIDRKMLHVGIDLFDAKELRDCINYQQSVKYEIKKKYAMPSFLKGGMYMVKVAAVPLVEAILKQAQESFPPVVEAFVAVLDTRREEAKQRLKGEYDESLYPTAEQVRDTFRIEWSWYSVGTPESLKKISEEFFQQEKNKHAKSLELASDGINSLLAAEAAKLAKHLVERLSPDDEGNQKQIRKSAVDNVRGFLETFQLRSVQTSEALQEQITKIEKLVSGVDARDLRVNDGLRATVSEGFKEVAAALDALVVAKPKRYMGGTQ
jgi:hypothetical protein